MASLSVSVVGGEELARISAGLRRAGETQIRRQMVTDLRRVSKPIVPRVRNAIMAIPSKHDGTLRRELARATTLQVRSVGKETGIKVRVDGRKMPGSKRGLPSRMEGKVRWRHPVFGDPDVWVGQNAHPYFYKNVEPLSLKVRAQIFQILNEAARYAR